MRDWFPFTNYDFYAYLTAGMIVIGAIDHAFGASALAGQNWTVISGFFWAAVAYLAGQILAIPSSVLFEHVVARWMLLPPSVVLLGIKAPRKREQLVRALLGAREYAPFPEPNRRRILEKLASSLGIEHAAVSGEAAFQCAFPRARSIPDTANRLDNFLNQYGMCRNVAFASAIAAVILANAKQHTSMDTWLVVGAVVLSVGLFSRFVKFYAAYAREVFRTFDMVAGS